MAKIFTHFSVDLDAVVSVWLVKRFLGFADAVVNFVPANWSGSDMTAADIAVDISCGIKGIDQDGEQHCASWALWLHLNEVDQDALRDLITYVDLQDCHGEVLSQCGLANHADADMLRETGLNSVFRGIQGTMKSDEKTLAFMETVLDGLYDKTLARIRAEAEAATAEFVGSVAVIRNAQEFGTNGVLFSRGAKAVVFVDGNNMGLVRRSDVTISMSDPAVLAEVPEEESAEWFAHPAGFLFARGTRKAPASTPTKVSPVALAQAVSNLLG